MAKQVIPSIHIPIQEKDGSISWVWYMFLKYLSSVEGGSGASSLSQLSDVNISSPTNNQYLVYDNGIWKNQTLSISWGQIGGDIEDQVDLKNALDSKQNVLTAGTNITIDENNVISAIGDSLPDQTDNAGKFLTTNGTGASWGNLKITSTQVIVGTTWNVAPYTVLVGVNSYSWTTRANYGVAVGYTAACYTYSVAVGANSIASGDYSIAVGYHATAPGNNSITIGAEAHSGARNSVCIGYDAETTSNAQNAIQIGSGVNRVANTLMVANGNGNFEMMSADGTIPEARLADTISATEGQVLTLDANGNAKWEDASSGGAGHNVGDIFFTMRTDNELNGAVECDGATYNTTDFTGTESIGELLEAGKLDYVSLSAYSTAISTKGWCDKIGWDGTGNTQFRVPTLNAHIVQTNNIPVVGNGMTLGLSYDNSSNAGLVSRNFDTLQTCSTAYGTSMGTTGQSGSGLRTDNRTVGITTDSTKSGLIADTTDTAQLRVMIQLATGATDTALETCTGVLADVATLKGYDYVVESQLPTAQNNYTWYRKYKSGWVEQGGKTSTSGTQTLPVTMADTNYTVIRTNGNGRGATIANELYTSVGTRTTTTIYILLDSNIAPVFWQVSGMAAG